MTDGLRDALEDVLPRGDVPFTIDGHQIAANGRRIRRRRRLAVAAAATTTVAVVALLLPAMLSGVVNSPVPAPPGGGSATSSILEAGWLLEAQEPFTDQETALATSSLLGSAEEITGYAELSGVDGSPVEFGRYLETSPDGRLSREIFLAAGRFTVSGQPAPTDFQIAILPPGSGADAYDFVECGSAGATCGPSSGPQGEAVVFARSEVGTEAGAIVETFDIVVYRPDTSVVEFKLMPNPAEDSATGVVVPPVISPQEATALALAVP